MYQHQLGERAFVVSVFNNTSVAACFVVLLGAPDIKVDDFSFVVGIVVIGVSVVADCVIGIVVVGAVFVVGVTVVEETSLVVCFLVCVVVADASVVVCCGVGGGECSGISVFVAVCFVILERDSVVIVLFIFKVTDGSSVVFGISVMVEVLIDLVDAGAAFIISFKSVVETSVVVSFLVVVSVVVVGASVVEFVIIIVCTSILAEFIVVAASVFVGLVVVSGSAVNGVSTVFDLAVGKALNGVGDSLMGCLDLNFSVVVCAFIDVGWVVVGAFVVVGISFVFDLVVVVTSDVVGAPLVFD